jgi:hypothetical protein
MAVFGPQLIYTVIIFVILAKLGRFYSLGRYLLCHKLYRYLSPSTDELKKAVRLHYKNLQSKASSSNKNSKKQLSRLYEIDDEKPEFNIPEGLELELKMNPVHSADLALIKYTDDFQSFVDISCIGLLIYLITEVYTVYFPRTALAEINLSIVWCGVILLYGLGSLAAQAKNYLRSSDEASLLYIFASLSFVLSLLIQLGDTKIFDFQLKDAFRNFTQTTHELIDQVTNSTSESTNIYSKLKHVSTNELLFTCFIATCSAVMGALLFFPSFRLAKLHLLCLKYSADSKLHIFLFYVNFLLPLCVSLCWIRPNFGPAKSSNQTDDLNSTVSHFLSLIRPENPSKSIYFEHLISIASGTNVRVYLVLCLFVLRLALYRLYAQGYLNLAYEVALSLRRRAQRITNLKYQAQVSSIYQYYGVVASQYVIPCYILLFLGLMLKTLGQLSWCVMGANNEDIFRCEYVVETLQNYTNLFVNNKRANSPTLSAGVLKMIEEHSNLNVTLGGNALSRIFTPYVLSSVIGYFTFWTSTIWFAISCFGLLYYQYIDKVIVINE